MAEQTDVHHSLNAKVILRAVLLLVLFAALFGRVSYRPSLIHLLGTGLQKQLTIPVFSIGTQSVTPISLLEALLFFGILTVLSNGVRRFLYRRVSGTNAFGQQHSYVLARFVSLLIYVFVLLI